MYGKPEQVTDPTSEGRIGVDRQPLPVFLGEQPMICFWCCENFKKLTRDHVIPQAVRQFFGRDANKNIVMACEKCNNERGSLVSYAMEILRAKSEEVTRQTIVNLHYRREEMLKARDKWEQIETEKWGSSPSADLCFDPPELNRNSKSKPPAIDYKILKEARRLAESQNKS